MKITANRPSNVWRNLSERLWKRVPQLVLANTAHCEIWLTDPKMHLHSFFPTIYTWAERECCPAKGGLGVWELLIQAVNNGIEGLHSPFLLAVLGGRGRLCATQHGVATFLGLLVVLQALLLWHQVCQVLHHRKTSVNFYISGAFWQQEHYSVPMRTFSWGNLGCFS